LCRRVEMVLPRCSNRCSLPSPVGMDHGVAIFPQDAEQTEQLIRIADERLYRLKQANHSKSGNGSSRTETPSAPEAPAAPAPSARSPHHRRFRSKPNAHQIKPKQPCDTAKAKSEGRGRRRTPLVRHRASTRHDGTCLPLFLAKTRRGAESARDRRDVARQPQRWLFRFYLVRVWFRSKSAVVRGPARCGAGAAGASGADGVSVREEPLPLLLWFACLGDRDAIGDAISCSVCSHLGGKSRRRDPFLR